MSLISMIAGALEPRFISGFELEEALPSLKEVITKNWAVNEKPEFFCFGLLESFDVPQLAALLDPRPVRGIEPSQRP